VDDDGDGVRSAACGGRDCDDGDAARFPGAVEVCDGDDEDCDATTLGPDRDGDGYVATECCNESTNCGDDCDDTLNTVNPRAAEACNGGVDDDCDGVADAADGVCVPCPAGYTGLDDDCADVDECATAGFCRVGAASCTNVPGTFVCTCGPGYAPESPAGGVCANIDECAAPVNPCGAGTCVDNAGSYVCGCPDGYRLVSTPRVTCLDVDECAAGTDDCDESPRAACTNRPGGFACSCPAGSTGAGRGLDGCADVDECELDLDDCDDDPDACDNVVDGFQCVCPAGFAGPARGASGCLLDDPSLSGLEVGAGATLSPRFAATTTTYVVRVTPNSSPVTLTPRVASPTRATIAVDGVVVASGEAVSIDIRSRFAPRVVSLIVTTESGATRAYSVSLVRDGVLIKAGNADAHDRYGWSVALSADGSTLAVGATDEDSTSRGVGGDGTNNDTWSAGAVYVYRRDATGTWAAEAYVKASNTRGNYVFGTAVSLSADGSVLVVGSYTESSSAVGIDGDASSVGARESGAAYVFRRSSTGWQQEAYVKASNTNAGDGFGLAVTVSADGGTVAVGAFGEDSAALGIGGMESSNAAVDSGAVYVFRRGATTWAQEAYVKSSRASRSFGWDVDLSADGRVLAVGAREEFGGGAAYVFRREATGGWTQDAVVRAASVESGDEFGVAVALSTDGAVLAVGAYAEDSMATGVGGDATNNAAGASGAAFVFRRSEGVWREEAYFKASNTGLADFFGHSIALSGDGSVLVVGAMREDSAATGINGNEWSEGADEAGAVYAFRLSSGGWRQEAYVKAFHASAMDQFGWSISLSADATTLAVGAIGDDSAGSGVGADATSAPATRFESGAVLVY
jgi:hypothetical protein